MGREALIHAEVAGEAGEVRALLESGELILRGDIRRRFARPALENVGVEGEILRFACGGETVRLHLGAEVAASWASVIAKPPPSLRAKLGLNKGARALVIGSCDDAALIEALGGATVGDNGDADMLIAYLTGPDDLAAALAVQGTDRARPLWAVYPKGKDVAFGYTAIRAALRAAGFRDTKSCAVSDRLTATRYNVG